MQPIIFKGEKCSSVILSEEFIRKKMSKFIEKIECRGLKNIYCCTLCDEIILSRKDEFTESKKYLKHINQHVYLIDYQNMIQHHLLVNEALRY